MVLSKEAADTLERRRAAIREGGGADKLTARHEKGQLGARERLERLFSPGTFQESGAHVRHCATSFGLSGREFPADGVIKGCMGGIYGYSGFDQVDDIVSRNRIIVNNVDFIE